MSFFSSVASGIASGADSIAKSVSPDYEQFTQKAHSYGSSIKTRGIVAVIAAVALAVIGIVLCAVTGPVGIAFGATFIAGSLALLYFGLNMLKMGENINSMSKNVIESAWKTFSFSEDKFKENLVQEFSKGTLWFNWMAEREVNSLLYGNQEKTK